MSEQYWFNMDSDIELMRGDEVIATWTDEEIAAEPRKFIDIARCCGDATYDMTAVLVEYGIIKEPCPACSGTGL
jgi:hypothetical protein